MFHHFSNQTQWTEANKNPYRNGETKSFEANDLPGEAGGEMEPW